MSLSKADKKEIEKLIDDKFKVVAAQLEADSRDQLLRIAHALRNHVQGPLHRR